MSPLHLSCNDRWCSDSFGLWLKCNQPNGASSNMHHFVHLDEIAVPSNIFCAAIWNCSNEWHLLCIAFTIAFQINLQHNGDIYVFYSHKLFASTWTIYRRDSLYTTDSNYSILPSLVFYSPPMGLTIGRQGLWPRSRASAATRLSVAMAGR